MDYYYSFNYLTTSELDSEVLHMLYTNIHMLLAMTDSDKQLEEEMEELSVREKDAGPPASTPSGDRAPTPVWGTGGEPPAGSGEERPTTPEMELAGAATSASTKPTEVVKLEAPLEASVSAADNSSLPQPESPRTRELKAKRKAKRKRQAENKRRKRAAESSTEKSSVNEPPPAKKVTRESSPQPTTSEESEVQPILLANPPIVLTRPKPIVKFSVRTGNGEPITGAMVDCALWTCPLDGCIVSIRERGGTEVVVEASASSAADDARCRLTSEGFAVGPVQKLGVRAHFDCPRNTAPLDPVTVLRGILGQNASMGLREGSLTFVSVSEVERRKEGGGSFKVRRMYVDVAAHAVAILNRSGWKLRTVTGFVTLRPVGGGDN